VTLARTILCASPMSKLNSCLLRMRCCVILLPLFVAACSDEPPCEISESLKKEAFAKIIDHFQELKILNEEDYPKMECDYRKTVAQFFSYRELWCAIGFGPRTALGFEKSVIGTFEMDGCKIVRGQYIQDLI